MSIVFLLIPLAAVLLGLAAVAFFWAINSGQYDDLDGAELTALEPDPPTSASPRESP